MQARARFLELCQQTENKENGGSWEGPGRVLGGSWEDPGRVLGESWENVENRALVQARVLKWRKR